MKNRKLLPFLAIFIIVSLSCSFLFPITANNNTNSPIVDFEATAEPLNVTVQLDAASTTSGMITAKGGIMSLTAGDGTVFTLEIPANALETDTAITMTAVKSITGAPLSSDAVAAVQLEPSGLFFYEIVTLTIVPAQEIPIESQIIFGYEGSGQDYHLAVVDPKSLEIKIKLMEFSGAGVGSGGDKEWAANLQIQASNASTRLWQKFGEFAQLERQKAILQFEDNSELVEQLKSTLDQFEDQVVLKEMVAAELDCTLAVKAMQDLLILGRMRQQAFSMETPNFNEKFTKLKKIIEECSKSYIVSGSSTGVTYTGEICSLNKPFVLNGTFPNGYEMLIFTPSSATGGAVEESGESDGCTNSGGGSYTVTLNEQGSGELKWTDTITSSCPPNSVTNTLSFSLPLNPASDLSCP